MSIAQTSGIAATGKYNLAKLASENFVLLTLAPVAGGTSAGVTFQVNASADNTNYDPILVVTTATGVPVTGGTTISPSDNTNYSWLIPNLTGFQSLQINVTGYGSGTPVFTSYGTNTPTPPFVNLTYTTGSFTNITASGTLAVTGASTFGSTVVVTSAASGALVVGANGSTHPVFNIDASAGSVATGLNLAGAAAGSGVALQVITSGTNEALTIDAAAAALITLGGAAATATGVQVGSSVSAANAVLTVYSSNAAALSVGANGATNPVLKVNANTGSVKTGLAITGAAAGSGIALAAISNATNENLTLDAKGSGTVTIGSISTGGVNIRLPVATVAASGTAIGNAAAVTEGYTYVTGANNANAVKLPVGAIGMQVKLTNATYTATLQVFPQVNAAIVNLAANAVYNIPNGGERTFIYAASNQWYTSPQTIV